MIELEILRYLMQREAQSNISRGRLVGFNIAWIQERYGIPKSTFYRRVKVMLSMGFITKQKRGYYVISPDFRQLANRVKVSSDITR